MYSERKGGQREGGREAGTERGIERETSLAGCSLESQYQNVPFALCVETPLAAFRLELFRTRTYLVSMSI